MRTLYLKPSGLPEAANKPWSLVLRSHDLGGTDYQTIACVSDEIAEEIAEARTVDWLFGKPDWNERARKRQLERARQLRDEAARIERMLGEERAAI